MSWQTYIDTHLVGTGKVSQAAIIGLEDKNIWAKSSGLQITPEELKKLAIAFNSDQTSEVQSKGLVISGKKYFTISINDESIQLKHKVDGACIYKTTRAIIVGAYESPIQQTECSTTVNGLSDYLKSLSY